MRCFARWRIGYRAVVGAGGRFPLYVDSITTSSDPLARLPMPNPSDGQVAVPEDPHRGLGIVGFALSFFVVLNFAGLIVSIVAVVRSKRAGFVNGFAVAGFIIAAVGVLFTLLVVALIAPPLIDA